MARPYVFNWTAANTTDVCAVQTLGGAGNLIINGNLTANSAGIGNSVSVSNPAGYIVSFTGCSRTVSITSTSNNSTVNVTVKGLLNGAAQTETIAGPNNTTIFTTKLFDTVTAVSTDAATVGAGLSVGSGTTGNTHWYGYDYYVSSPGLSVQVVVTGTINYTFQQTLDDVNVVTTPTANAGIVIPQPGNANAYQTVMSSASATAFAYILYPTRFVNILINSATTGSLVATFVQQGVR